MTVPTTQLPVTTCIVTTCMGRLEHLRETLPTWLEHTPYPVLVATFEDCPDNTTRWSKEQSARDDRVNGIQVPARGGVFDKARALNAALWFARTCGVRRAIMLDADTRVLGDIRVVEEPGTMFIAKPDKATGSLAGFLAADLAALKAAGDYDDGMVGYGAEDLDMRTRLYLRAAARLELVPPGLLQPIEHGDELRTRHYLEKDQASSGFRNLTRMISRLEPHEIEVLVREPDTRDILLGAELCPCR